MIANITKSIQAYFQAFSLISKLKLWRFFAIPISISIITAVVLFSVSYGLSDNIGNFIAKIWFWDWGKSTFTSISGFLGGLTVLAIGLILYKHIIMALSAPFMSPVSERIEKYLTQNDSNHHHRKTSFSEQLSRAVKLSVRNIGMELILTILLLLVGYIPIIGLPSAIFIFLVQSYYAGFGNMDYTLERHYKYRDSINFVKRHRGLAIGNGIVFMLFLLIPIIGVILVLPLSVTSASLVTVKAIKNENSI